MGEDRQSRMTSSTTSSKRAERFDRLNTSENDSNHSTLQQSPGCDNRYNRSEQSGVHWIVEQSETRNRRSNIAVRCISQKEISSLFILADGDQSLWRLSTGECRHILPSIVQCDPS
ncbi:hypothetical protein PSTT_01603 [Puccinia striiformis]|uniref:Uncharacterized protein n=1 Tax=Puccinia striiformis TaxID=27350 RepID=A0A2S4W2R8_9BASI|nr:hypothetical protein PSTT_01603 [Puccinia striiformis]